MKFGHVPRRHFLVKNGRLWEGNLQSWHSAGYLAPSGLLDLSADAEVSWFSLW
jgi:hypothetical protein